MLQVHCFLPTPKKDSIKPFVGHKPTFLIATVMTDQSFTPSWIKIDDDKFRDLLEYLCKKARSGGHDPFYSAAQELLKERVSSLMPELACGMEGSEDEQLFRIRLGGHIHKANGFQESLEHSWYPFVKTIPAKVFFQKDSNDSCWLVEE